MNAHDDENELAAEFGRLLDKAGIVLAPEKARVALTEFADMKKHVAIVNRACPPASEPSNIFVLPRVEMPK